MDETVGAALGLGELPAMLVPVVPIELPFTPDIIPNYHLSVSLRGMTVRKVRDLAVKTNVSDSAIVIAALQGLFDSTELFDLRSMVDRFGFVSRRRRT